MGTNVITTNELKNPTAVGIHYRLVCILGPNTGKVYYLIGKRILIGRGEKVDIQILDVKISREHAELSFANNAYTISDLGSQNRIIVNNVKVAQTVLPDGAKIIIGESAFKYNVINVKVSKELTIAENYPDSNLAKEIKKGVKVKISNYELPIKDAPSKSSQISNTSKRKVAIFLAILGSIIFLLFDEGEDVGKKLNPFKKTELGLDDFSESISSKKIQETPEVKKKLDALIHSGRREFREGNYFRAMEEFRLALLINPHNGESSFYLSKAKQKLDEEIMKNFEKGNQEQEAKKYQAAMVSFCSVVQLIKDYPDDDRYKNAMIKISLIESVLGMEEGEIKCLEKGGTRSRN